MVNTMSISPLNYHYAIETSSVPQRIYTCFRMEKGKERQGAPPSYVLYQPHGDSSCCLAFNHHNCAGAPSTHFTERKEGWSKASLVPWLTTSCVEDWICVHIVFRPILMAPIASLRGILHIGDNFRQKRWEKASENNSHRKTEVYLLVEPSVRPPSF